jgi:hypothetical protein
MHCSTAGVEKMVTADSVSTMAAMNLGDAAERRLAAGIAPVPIGLGGGRTRGVAGRFVEAERQHAIAVLDGWVAGTGGLLACGQRCSPRD